MLISFMHKWYIKEKKHFFSLFPFLLIDQIIDKAIFSFHLMTSDRYMPPFQLFSANFIYSFDSIMDINLQLFAFSYTDLKHNYSEAGFFLFFFVLFLSSTLFFSVLALCLFLPLSLSANYSTVLLMLVGFLDLWSVGDKF